MAIRTVIVGAGHLGKIHARIVKTLPEFELVGIVDPSADARRAAGEQFGVETTDDHRTWIGRADAAIIAAPTMAHRTVAIDFLSAGIPTFVEKPLAASVDEAAELVEQARRRQATLQVGHVERFNPAWTAVRPLLHEPRFIECVREGAFSFRSTDVGVVFDLMIHDVDLVLDLAGSPVVDVEARGRALLGRHEDTAYARLKFENGCTATLRASRVSPTATRRMNVESRDALAVVDFGAKQATITRLHDSLVRGEIDVERMTVDELQEVKRRLPTELLVERNLDVAAGDAVTAELLDFAASIRSGRTPQVSGVAGLEAVRVAQRIIDAVHAERLSDDDGPTVLRGPHFQRSGDADTQLRRRAGV